MEKRKLINNVKIALNPDTYHRILEKSPRSTLAEGLERSHDIRLLNKNKFKQKEYYDLTGTDASETETTVRVNEPIPIGPYEKTGPYSDRGFMHDIKDAPDLEGRLKKRRFKKNKSGRKYIKKSQLETNVKTSQKLSDYIKQVEHSAVLIYSIYNKTESFGSGFFINKTHILTCAHVLNLTNDQNENNEILSNSTIYIEFNNRYFPVTVALYDTAIDFAVLAINSEYYGIQENIYPINLGNSGNVNKGDYVIVIGNPLDMYNATKGGIVSYIGQKEIQNESNFIYIDTSVLPGDSGGMVYSTEKQAVIGIAEAFTYESSDETTFSNSLGVVVKIDVIKEFLKFNNIQFTYHENNNPTQAQLAPIVIRKNAKTQQYRGTTPIQDTDDKNEVVGPAGGSNPMTWGKEKNNQKYYYTMRPSTLSPSYWTNKMTGVDLSYSGNVRNSTPFDGMDEDLKSDLSIKNRLDMFDKEKGFWLFNIPLSMGTKGKEKLQVYKKNGDNFVVYYNGKSIMNVKKTDKIKKPLLYIMQELSKKFQFDTSYDQYIKDFGAHYTS